MDDRRANFVAGTAKSRGGNHAAAGGITRIDMKKAISLLVSIFAASAGIPAPAWSEREIGIRGYAWRPDVSAELQSVSSGVRETRFDLAGDAGLIEKTFGVAEIWVRSGGVRFRAGYTPALMNGNKVLEREIVFADLSYPAGAQARSHICIDLADLEVQYEPIRSSIGDIRLDLGVIGKLRYLNARAELHIANQSGERSFATPFLAIGAAASAILPGGWARVDARAAAGGYDSNRMLEGEAFASLILLPNFRLQVGYRHVDLDVDADDILAEIRLAGPYLGGEFSF